MPHIIRTVDVKRMYIRRNLWQQWQRVSAAVPLL